MNSMIGTGTLNRTLGAGNVHVKVDKTAGDRQTHVKHHVDADCRSVEAVEQTTGRVVLRHQPQFHPQTNVYRHTQRHGTICAMKQTSVTKNI